MKQIDLFAAPSPAPPPREIAYITCWSMHQPYAGLVAAGLKDETRLFPWPVKARPYPAPLLICSTAKPDSAALERLAPQIPDEYITLCTLLGVALAMVDVVGCRELTAEDVSRSWYWDPIGDKRDHPGKIRYLWRIANVRRVQPFLVSGGQGFSKSIDATFIGANQR